MTRALMIFVDGVGIGPRDPEVNPFGRFEPRVFTRFSGAGRNEAYGGGTVGAADATLGTPGIPQSATGQTAILTGVNAGRFLGRHLSGLPNRALKELLACESIFKKAAGLGLRSAFANAYQPSFFLSGRRWISATTAACSAAGVRLRTLDDLRRGEAVHHDFTRRLLRGAGIDVPASSPEQAGADLARIASGYDFTLYEYFLTDLAGHERNMARAVKVLEGLERFVCSVVEHSDPAEQLVLLTSDHGNIENLGRKSHTRHNVPVIAWGKKAGEVRSRIAAIEDTTPALLSALGRVDSPAVCRG